jgi:hypothetical protein
MQLQGPPRINDFTAPYPTAQTPLDAAFQDERESTGRIQTNLAGTKTYVGEPRQRGRFRLSWDGIEYDTASRILYELRSGECVLTPRTDIGGGGILDVTGDGIPDLLLSEVELPCRVVSEVPYATPLNRRGGGSPRAKLEVELETLHTYAEIPGFVSPPRFTFQTYATSGPWTLSFDFGPGVKHYVDFGNGYADVGTNVEHTYTADSGPWTVTVLLYQASIPRWGINLDVPNKTGRRVTNGRADLTGTDLSGIQIQDGGSVRLDPGEGRLVGVLTSAPQGAYQWNGQFGGGLTYDASIIPRSVREIQLDNDKGITGDVNDLPADAIVADLEDFSGTQNVLRVGGPVGRSTEIAITERGAVTLGDDFRFDQVNNFGPAPKVRRLVLRRGRQPKGLMYGMRQLEYVAGSRLRVDLSGDNLIPPTLTELQFGRSGIKHVPDDDTWVDQMTQIKIHGNGEGSVGKALSITDGVPQYQLLWNQLYQRRTYLQKSNGSPELDVNLHQTTDDGPGRNTELICTATSAEKLWRMVGYRRHKGDSVLDYVRSLNLSNLLQFNITRTGAQMFEFSWGLPDKTTQADPAIRNRQEFVYNDQASNNAPEAWVRDGTSRAWLPIFTSGEQVRLQGPTSDELVEISSVTYDPSANAMSVSVTDSPSLPSSSGSIPSDADRMTYAFFFYSTT